MKKVRETKLIFSNKGKTIYKDSIQTSLDTSISDIVSTTVVVMNIGQYDSLKCCSLIKDVN